MGLVYRLIVDFIVIPTTNQVGHTEESACGEVVGYAARPDLEMGTLRNGYRTAGMGTRI